MSPVSLRKVSDAGARVQVPFTSSETRTCPGASYWETQPTSRSPWATRWVSVTVTVEMRDPVENAAPWTQVGVVDPATAVRGSRAPRVANTARPTVARADGDCFIVTSPAVPGGGALRAAAESRSRAASLHVSNRRPGPLSRTSRQRPHASRARDTRWPVPSRFRPPDRIHRTFSQTAAADRSFKAQRLPAAPESEMPDPAEPGPEPAVPRQQVRSGRPRRLK